MTATGSSRRWIKIAGSNAQSYTYDSFGNVTASTGTVANPFQFTAREFDPETALYYYRARYYDASAGRFLNEDPLGVNGGINLYRYALNSPTNYFDPLGLVAEECRPPKCNAAFPSSPANAQLAQLVYAEGNGTPVGDLAIASVVVNRANYGSPGEFGIGILGVISKPYQFQAYNNAIFNSVNAPAKVAKLSPADCLRYQRRVHLRLGGQDSAGERSHRNLWLCL
jgi:RHS repeat-associated protein